MTQENAQALRTRRVRTLTVIFAGQQDRPPWAPTGEVSRSAAGVRVDQCVVLGGNVCSVVSTMPGAQ